MRGTCRKGFIKLREEADEVLCLDILNQKSKLIDKNSERKWGK